MSGAIDQAKASLGASRITLVGYSGGGVIAALLAARRRDMDEFITLAANLDHRLWTEMDDLTPLSGSLNPADMTGRLQGVRQRHFVGADDDVVSPQVVRSYMAKMTDPSRTKLFILKGFNHDCCWTKAWPSLLTK